MNPVLEQHDRIINEELTRPFLVFDPSFEIVEPFENETIFSR